MKKTIVTILMIAIFGLLPRNVFAEESAVVENGEAGPTASEEVRMEETTVTNDDEEEQKHEDEVSAKSEEETVNVSEEMKDATNDAVETDGEDAAGTIEDTIAEGAIEAEVAAAVEVGGVSYASLDEAIANATPGATITVLADLDLTDKRMEVIEFPDGVTFDLGGYTISTENMGLIYTGKNLTIKNGTFAAVATEHEPRNSYALFIGDENDTDNVVVENVKCEGGINIYNATNVTLKNVTAVAHEFYTVWADAHAMITIESGDYSTSENSTDVFGISTDGGSYIHIYGGTFTATNDNLVLGGKYIPPVIYGGLYNVDPTEYVAEGTKVTQLKNGWFRVGEIQVDVNIDPLNPDEGTSGVGIGIVDTTNAGEILKEMVDSETMTDKDVTVKFEICPVNVDIATRGRFEQAITSAYQGAQIADFFDVNIKVVDESNGAILETITELDEKIKLVVTLPESLRNHDPNVTRKYYILREHDGKIEILDVMMAADGKSLTFETDKFSTYALAYVDTLNISADDPNNGEASSGIGDVGGNQNNGWNMGNIINPSTSDKIATSLAIFVISIIGLGGVITYMRTKRNLN